MEANAVTDGDDDTAADSEEARGAKRERSLEASMKAVKGLCEALDRRVSTVRESSYVQRIVFFFQNIAGVGIFGYPLDMV